MVVAVVQARMSSRRLPGKVLAPLGDRPVLQFLLERLRAATTVDAVVVATTSSAEDDGVAELAAACRAAVVRGSEEDVLSRYLQILEGFPAEMLVRVTADNPFTDPVLLDGAVRLALRERYEYVHCPDAPVGTAVDVFAADTIARSARNGRTSYQREHVNAYVLGNPDRFRIGVYDPPPPWRRPDVRLTIDTAEDLARLTALVDVLPEGAATPLDELLDAVDRVATAG